MAGFSVADAAFTGFRIVWRRPVSLIAWSVVQFAAAFGVTLFITVSAGAEFQRFLDPAAQLGADPAQTMALLAAVGPTMLVLMIASLVLHAVLYAAMNRAVLRPGDSRFGYLRLASDELRQLALFALLFVAVYLGVGLVGGIVLTLLTALLGEAIAAAIALLLIPVVLCGLVFLGVRFSLASPLTFDRGRIDLLGSWRLTKGRFWPLLATYVLALVLSLVVQALMLAIAIFAVAIIGGGFAAIGQAGQADFGSLAAQLTPAALINLVVSSIGQALSFPITMSPPATIYRALTSVGGSARAFD